MPDQKHFARELRQHSTDAEILLWSRLRRKGIPGYRFRRQHPVGPYILDFACLRPRVAIELDGGQHYENPEYDRRRDEYLKSQDFEILHFPNHQIFEDLDAVLDQIYETLEQTKTRTRSPRLQPPP